MRGKKGTLLKSLGTTPRGVGLPTCFWGDLALGDGGPRGPSAEPHPAAGLPHGARVSPAAPLATQGVDVEHTAELRGIRYSRSLQQEASDYYRLLTPTLEMLVRGSREWGRRGRPGPPRGGPLGRVGGAGDSCGGRGCASSGAAGVASRGAAAGFGRLLKGLKVGRRVVADDQCPRSWPVGGRDGAALWTTVQRFIGKLNAELLPARPRGKRKRSSARCPRPGSQRPDAHRRMNGHTCVRPHGECHWATRRREALTLAMMWTDLENGMLCELFVLTFKHDLIET